MKSLLLHNDGIGALPENCFCAFFGAFVVFVPPASLRFFRARIRTKIPPASAADPTAGAFSGVLRDFSSACSFSQAETSFPPVFVVSGAFAGVRAPVSHPRGGIFPDLRIALISRPSVLIFMNFDMGNMLKYIRRVLATAVLLLSCAAPVSCIREDTGDCPVPHHFDYDWCNRVEAEGCLGQNHLRLYDGGGVCDPHDRPRRVRCAHLKQAATAC